MSTRACIIIRDTYKNKVILYHHHDGYPEGLGTELRELCEAIKPMYYYTSCELANMLVKHGIRIYKDNGKGEEVWHDNEFELSCDLHGDIEYLYHLDISAEGEDDTRPVYNVKGFRVRMNFDVHTQREYIKELREVEIPYDKDAENLVQVRH